MFSLDESLQHTNRTPTASSRNGDPFSHMSRQTSGQPSYPQHGRERGATTGRIRNGFGPHGDTGVSIPSGAVGRLGGPDRNGGGLGVMQPFEIARSPPNSSNKNTKHVPCKFFIQGTCQAGNACPFSHTLDPLTQQAPCKYFMKGNCKFGAKCALAHYLPDGRRVNRSEIDYGMGMNGRPLNLGGRVEPPLYQNQDSALAHSLLAQQQFQTPDMFPTQFAYPEQDDGDVPNDRYSRYNQPYPVSSIDAGLHSPPGSHFGSPPDDFHFQRSPVENLRTALNAPLPQSFDSNGISHIAKYGPLGHSLPDKFGMKSMPGSLPKKAVNPSEAAPGIRTGSKIASPLGLSPQAPDESLSARVVHAQRLSKTQGLPASVPRSGLIDDWEDRFNLDADMLPNSLHDEVLTPQEKIRRLSRPDQDFSGYRDPSNGLAIPSAPSSKVGSPGAAGSPSRFRALWEEQREKKGAETTTTSTNAFGHVGSPLRESWMPNGSSNSPRNTSMSGISQQMARMKLDRTESAESAVSRPHPSSLRHSSAPHKPFERTISSPKMMGRKIEEDGEGAFFFPMDDDSKRTSNFWSAKSPALEPMRDPLDSTSTKENKPNGVSSSDGVKSMFSFRP